MENEVFNYIQDLNKHNKRVTTLIIFWRVAEIYILFEGGKYIEDYISKMIIWFYKIFMQIFSLSYVRIIGAPIKLPKDWKENSEQIIACLGCDKTPHTDANSVFIYPIQDQDYYSNDHIQVNIDMPGNYKWCEINTGWRKICTGDK